MSFLSFGAVLWDIIEGREYLGGAPFNVAAHLARCGARSLICTSVGNDDRGLRVLAEMQRLGVDATFVNVDPQHPTGTVSVELHDGQPSYVIHEQVAWDFIRVQDDLLDRLAEFQLQAFCFGSLDQRNVVSRQTLVDLLDRLPDIPVYFDVNLRQSYYTEDILRHSLERSSILKLNDEETRVLGQLLFDQERGIEEFSRAAADEFGLAVVVVTLGGEGCAVLHQGSFTRVRTQPVTVIDAVGAGDAFSAGFLWKYCQGASPVEAAELANQLGAFVASQRGAIPEYSREIRQRLGL